MKEFEFNKYGVCLNPNMYDVQCKKGRCQIRTAKNEEKWTYGISIDLPMQGMSTPASIITCNYVSEKDAFEKAKILILSWLENKCDTDELKKEIKGKLLLNQHPTLFDLWD